MNSEDSRRICLVMYAFAILLVFTLFSSNVLAVDGYVAYRSNSLSGLNTPKINYWNNTANGGNGSWSGEVELATTGSPIRQLVLKQSPISSKIVLVTLSDDGNLDGYVCMHDCLTAGNWVFTSGLGLVWTTGAPQPQRRYDISYETSTGNLLLVYAINDTNAARDLAFKILPESSTTFGGLATQYVNDAIHATNVQYSWIALDSDPLNDSKEIAITGFDATDNDINAWIWDGTTFGQYKELTSIATSTSSREALAVKYVTDGSKAMVVGGFAGNGFINWTYWNGTVWSPLGSFDIDPGDANDANWITIKADPTSDDLQLTCVDSGSDLETVYWNTTDWILTTNIDTGVDSAASRVADFSWLPTGGAGRLIWDTDGAAASNSLSVRDCTPQCTAATQTFTTYAGTGAWLTLFRNPSTSDLVEFLGIRLNSAFDIGSFRYNGTGLGYTNYGDTSLTTGATVSTFEAYSFDYRRDNRPPNVTFISPKNGFIQQFNSTFINITSNEYLPSAFLEWNQTINYTMNGADMYWNFTMTDLVDGFYTYKVFIYDWAGNLNISETRNITIDTPPSIYIMSPQNNTLNTTSLSIFFQYNVSDVSDNIANCSLIIDHIVAMNTSGTVSKNTALNFTLNLTRGQHNWSINCTDTAGFNASSDEYNITIKIYPVIKSITIDDGLAPVGEVMLQAGSYRTAYCNAVVTDPFGPNYIKNISSTLYYLLNKSSDPDDNNVHYSNNSCTINNTNAFNTTYSCAFNMMYYSNNGTWFCNITVYNNDSNPAFGNVSTLVQALYAINITDGISFGTVESNIPSNNLTANISNFGNMPINISLQGYAMSIGDNVGMNCSDNTNISITNIHFTKLSSLDYAQKTLLNGSIQPLNLTLIKQINNTIITNSSYWQIMPDPGSKNRYCEGFIIFNAEVS